MQSGERGHLHDGDASDAGAGASTWEGLLRNSRTRHYRSVTGKADAGSIQHLLAKVFSSVDAAVAIVNGAGRIVMTNRGCDLLLGYAPNALVGLRLRSRLWPLMHGLSHRGVIKQHKADEHDISYSSTVLRADGSELEVSSVLRDRDDPRRKKIPHRHAVRSIAGGTGGPDMRSESVGRIKLVGLDGVRAALGIDGRRWRSGRWQRPSR